VSDLPAKLAAALAACVVLASVGRGAEPTSPPPTFVVSGEPPQVRNVSPPAPVAGKDLWFFILGHAFGEDEAKVEVKVGDVKAVSVQVLSPTRLKALIPASTKPGWAVVTVTNPDKLSDTLEGAVYFRAPGSGFNWDAFIANARYDWRGFVEWFNLGGPVMPFIALLSLFGVAWCVHCLLVLRRSQVMPARFVEALSSYLLQGDIKGAAATSEKTSCAFGRIALAGLRRAGDTPEHIREAINSAGGREAARLHQKISYLANIGVLAPMLGLLGTVFGMILAFSVISAGDVQHYQVAGALAHALVATAGGLIIGVPAMALYFYLRGRLVHLTAHMEMAADEVARSVIEKGEGE
jgi:biopolymer transport protein ExbB